MQLLMRVHSRGKDDIVQIGWTVIKRVDSHTQELITFKLPKQQAL